MSEYITKVVSKEDRILHIGAGNSSKYYKVIFLFLT
jgi:hypothetical protein